MRSFETFQYRDAVYRLCGSKIEIMKDTIRSLRNELDSYVSTHRDFLESMVPVDCYTGAPDIALEMCRATAVYGIGPMAAVAGIISEKACSEAVMLGAEEAVIDNGGDCFLITKDSLTVTVFAADSSVSGKIGFTVPPNSRIAVCSSSSRMGHSRSFGKCSLVTVVAESGAVADAAATYYCNSVKSDDYVDRVIELAEKDRKITGMLIINRDKIALCGDFPQLVKINLSDVKSLIAAHPLSGIRFL